MRWSLARIPLAGNYYFYIGVFYGISGANTDDHKNTTNERYLQKIFSILATLGDVPVLLCMDANVTIQRSSILRGAIRTGRWHDLADGYDVGGTYFRDPSMRGQEGEVTSRIDFIFGNSVAKTAQKSFRRVTDESYKNRLPIEAAFDLRALEQRGHALAVPRAFPVWEVPVDRQSEAQSGQHLWNTSYRTRLEEAMATNNVEIAWTTVNNYGKQWLAELCASSGTPYDRGRGKPPRRRALTIAARQSKDTGLSGALPKAVIRLLKSERRLRSLQLACSRHDRWAE